MTQYNIKHLYNIVIKIKVIYTNKLSTIFSFHITLVKNKWIHTIRMRVKQNISKIIIYINIHISQNTEIELYKHLKAKMGEFWWNIYLKHAQRTTWNLFILIILNVKLYYLPGGKTNRELIFRFFLNYSVCNDQIYCIQINHLVTYLIN